MQEILVRRKGFPDERYPRDRLIDKLLLQMAGEHAEFYCMCQVGVGLPMHKCRHGKDGGYLKRHAGTGGLHAESCPSFCEQEDPGGHGSSCIRRAIETIDGVDEVHLNLPLSGQTPAAPSLIGGATLKAGGQSKVVGRAQTTMLGLVRHLAHVAEINDWNPKRAQEKDWNAIGRNLETAARKLRINGRWASSALVIPRLSNQQDLQSRIDPACGKAPECGKRYLLVVGHLQKAVEHDTHFDLMLECFAYKLQVTKELWRGAVNHVAFPGRKRRATAGLRQGSESAGHGGRQS